MKKLLAAALFLCAAALPARASDLNDLWWNANENGWGVNVSHQGDILFLTFFVYGPNNQPIWYSASSVQFQSTNASGSIYSGRLFQTTGPYFGAQFYNPAQVVGTDVGSVTFTVNAAGDAATLAYTVEGVPVSKQVTRLTFRANPNVTGTFLGAVVGDLAGCPPPFFNGHFEAETTLFSIAGNAANTQVVLQSPATSCTIAGPYTQSGRLGRVQGTITCANGVNGTSTVSEVEGNGSGMTARYTASYTNGCQETGRIAGVRR
jgi:hypothetical protein